MNPNIKRYIALFSLSMGAAASYTLVYIKYIFYDAWVAGLALPAGANEKAGLLLTYYMAGCTILYVPGGYVADKFSPKKIILLSLLGTGILDLWYSFDPSYGTAKIIWFLQSFTTGFAFWAAAIKAVRMLGSPKEQGQMYGWYNSGEGAFSAGILGIATVAYGMSMVASLSLKYASWVMGGFCFVAAVMTWIFFDEKTAQGDTASEDEKFHAKDIMKVIKNPWVWCCSMVIICSYATYTGQSYITPYMTQVVGMSATAGAVVGILRTKGARFIGGPIGGIIADRIGSPCKVIIGSNILMILLLLLFFFLPVSQMAVFAIILSILVALVNFAGYNIMFASMEEARIPRYLTGTAAGIISILGYSPDGFLNAIFGKWLDDYGDAGHNYIFITLIVMCIIGSFFCYLIMRNNQKLTKQEGN